MPGHSSDKVPLFFHREYLVSQDYPHLHSETDPNFLSHFTISGALATSLERSPFGGIVRRPKATLPQFLRYHQKLKDELSRRGTTLLRVVQPPPIYDQLVPGGWLTEVGYQPALTDLHHVLPLEGALANRMHPMELRKLKNGQSKFEIKVGGISASDIHSFIRHCRMSQGLEINISRVNLERLVGAFPERYCFFTAWQGHSLAAAMVMVLPVKKIAYSFLPATDPAFKSQSPMVTLLHYIGEHYQKQGFSHLDLGITSIRGEEQHSLATFKERMGAQRMHRITYEAKIA